MVPLAAPETMESASPGARCSTIPLSTGGSHGDLRYARQVLAQALQQISADRTTKAVSLVQKFGGKVQARYATLGPQDLVLAIDFPGAGKAMQASAGLAKLTGISFATSEAVAVGDFDRLMGEK